VACLCRASPHFAQRMKSSIGTASMTIGMKAWFTPHSSEHIPRYTPGRAIFNLTWLSRPGTPSILIPSSGIAQEWITSADVTSTRI